MSATSATEITKITITQEINVKIRGSEILNELNVSIRLFPKYLIPLITFGI